MIKEEFIDTLQACYFGDRGAFNKIVKEYDELHNKIDKAIEYIEKDTCYNSEHTYYDVDVEDILTILEILKDSDVDE